MLQNELLVTSVSSIALSAAGSVPAAKELEPTLKDIKYGLHERNVLNFWKAESDKPTPVLMLIHGGGWGSGSKQEKIPPTFYLPKGISVVSISYRLLQTDILPAPVHDAARALQFVRSKAEEWNIDKNKIAVTGGSAGGCTSLWLIYHDDMANPDSDDPVERESTKPTCAAVEAAQTCIEPMLTRKWVGDMILRHAMVWKAVGAESPEDLLENYDKYRELSREFSPYLHVDKNDPSAFLFNCNSTVVPAANVSDAIHHPLLSLKLKEKADEVGAECHVLLSGTKKSFYEVSREFIESKLLGDGR